MAGRFQARAVFAGAFLLGALSVHAFESNCRNWRDDDGDGAIDCRDPDCGSDPYCREADNCLDEWDNDNDGFFDCQDPDCATHDGCTGAEICDNGVDDDGDTLIDCAERQCPLRPGCLESNCFDGIDDERDGYIDCMDVQCCIEFACAISPRCQPQLPGEWCANGRDDDGDGLVDCEDTDCAPACADADSDGDGHADADDCAPSDAATWSAPPEVTGLRVGATATGVSLAWQDLSSQAGPSIRYDVVSGAVADLSADGSMLLATCLQDDATITEAADTRGACAPGAACYYLVRGQNSCGDGDYGAGAPAIGCP